MSVKLDITDVIIKQQPEKMTAVYRDHYVLATTSKGSKCIVKNNNIKNRSTRSAPSYPNVNYEDSVYDNLLFVSLSKRS